MTKSVSRKDCDGHSFKVPAAEVAEFDAALERINAAKFGSAEFYVACEDFNARFWKYAGN